MRDSAAKINMRGGGSGPRPAPAHQAPRSGQRHDRPLLQSLFHLAHPGLRRGRKRPALRRLAADIKQAGPDIARFTKGVAREA